MDPVDKKKTVKYFFDTAPACRNERVNFGVLITNMQKQSVFDHYVIGQYLIYY